MSIPTANLDGTFASREDLLNVVKEYAKTHGFAISIVRSKEDSVHISCNRGGSARPRMGVDRQRRRDSRRCGCPFQIQGVRRRANEAGDIDVWRLETRDGSHNHGPAPLKSYPQYRKLDREQIQFVKSHLDLKPRDLLRHLRELFPDLLVMDRDVYNVRARVRRDPDASFSDNDVEPGQELLGNGSNADYFSTPDHSEPSGPPIDAELLAESNSQMLSLENDFVKELDNVKIRWTSLDYPDKISLLKHLHDLSLTFPLLSTQTSKHVLPHQ